MCHLDCVGHSTPGRAITAQLLHRIIAIGKKELEAVGVVIVLEFAVFAKYTTEDMAGVGWDFGAVLGAIRPQSTASSCGFVHCNGCPSAKR